MNEPHDEQPTPDLTPSDYRPQFQYPNTAPSAPYWTQPGYPGNPGNPGNPGYPGYPPPAGYAPPGYPWTAPLPPTETALPAPSRRRVLITSGIAAVIAAACIAGAVATNSTVSLPGSGTAATSVLPDSTGNGAVPGNGGNGGNGSSSGNGGSGNGGFGGNGSTGTGGSTTTGTANATQSIGVVDINTDLKYQNAQAAGTGLVLTSNGEILTNNHVVEGATSITVTVVSTAKTYTATVVGTDPSDDIAVLQLSNASGLQTAKISTSATVAVGDVVTAVGNAGGTGGTPSTATGTVTALNQSITATDTDGSNSENLTGLIESNAPIQPGDSGGPLYNANGEIIGIDTAGSSSSASPRGFSASTLTQAYSIPIGNALSIAAQIVGGHASSTIHLGYPAFVGVQIAATNSRGQFGGTTGSGAVVSGVVAGTPAATAGIAARDTITAVGSAAITSPTDLSTALSQYQPGQSVKVSWTDAAGQQHSATVKLIAGPAD